jgi:copper(I)-binding protein
MSRVVNLRGAIALLCATSLSLAGCRHEPPPEHVTTFEMQDAWVRATPDSGATTAAYMKFVNGTSSTVVVSGFSSSDANTVELHRSSTDAEGEAHMSMQDSLAIAPGQSVTLKPGGYHLMLIGTTHPLLPGKLARLVMRLSDGSVVSTSARIKS